MCKKQLILILGAPGSGKGTISKYLCSKFNYKHISPGDILRAVKKEDKNYNYIHQRIDNGNIVTIDVLLPYMKDIIINTNYDAYILDGFPCDKENKDVFEKEMIKTNICEYKHIIYLNCLKSVLIDRLKNRNRYDDDINIVNHRLEYFYNTRLPIIKLFEKEQNNIFKNINVNNDFDSNIKNILNIL